MMDKEYARKYYQDHKEEYRIRQKRKYDPEKARARRNRYKDRVEKGIVIPRKRNKKLKDLYLDSYGKNLNKRVDSISRLNRGRRVMCLDCADHNDCPGWENCPYREVVLEEINKKGGIK